MVRVYLIHTHFLQRDAEVVQRPASGIPAAGLPEDRRLRARFGMKSG